MLKTSNFPFYSGETTNITSTGQFAVHATFCFDDVISEHFIGFIPISKVVGFSLSAPIVVEALKQFFIKRDISLQYARFTCMDTTNVNSGEMGDLKCYLKHKVPLLRLGGCNSHKLVLCFKHLIPQFPSIDEADVFLLNLWQCFKISTSYYKIFLRTLQTYFDDPVVPVCPDMLCWAAHEWTCLTFFKG